MKNQHVVNLAKRLQKQLKSFCEKIKVAGSIRRKEKEPRDIDFVLIPKDKQKILDFLNSKGKELEAGDKKARFKIEGVKVETYFTTQDSWGATLLAYSSKKGSSIGLRKLAKEKGFHLNQYGLFKGKKKIAGKTEKEIYKALARSYKEPWNR